MDKIKGEVDTSDRFFVSIFMTIKKVRAGFAPANSGFADRPLSYLGTAPYIAIFYNFKVVKSKKREIVLCN